jgi:hypothetical protein
MTTKVSLKVTSYAQLRDTIHHSGLFDMTDCDIKLTCPEASPVEEIERMVNVLESVINVVKVDIVIDRFAFEYLVDIHEVPVDNARGKLK